MKYLEILNSLINEKTIVNENLNLEQAFTEICIDYLQDSFLLQSFNHSTYYNDKNNIIKIDGFSLSENEDILSLFVTNYNTSNEIKSLTKNDLELKFKQLYRALNYTIFSSEEDIPKSHILKSLHHQYSSGNDPLNKKIVQIKFYLLTNDFCVNKKEIKVESILNKSDSNSKIDYNIYVVDLNELERLHKNTLKNDIEISEYYNGKIEVLKPNLGGVSYGTYIVILPGIFIYEIYKDLGAKLLESNVRSFLSKTKVNKGITETLKNNPSLFLAYNNGLCITVSSIELNPDGTVKKFYDFQIVNGGQTTSSIYFSKKNNPEIRLERVNVMAKITELKRNIDSSKIQTKIAINSNIQNPVKVSDLSSNDEFLRNLNSFSKKLRNPHTNNYYYFERTRGQYISEKNLLNNDNKFELLYPKINLLTKTELTILYYNSFSDNLRPYISVWSDQKRYEEFIKIMNDENKKISDDYYKAFCGCFILNKYFIRIYGTGKNSIGKIRKNVVSYSIGLIQYTLKKSDQSIDFKKIWEKGTSNINESVLRNFLVYINKLILDNLDDGRVDEACKKEESWKTIVKNINDFELNKIISLIPVQKYKSLKINSNSDDLNENKFSSMIEEINSTIYDYELFGKILKRVSEEIESNLEDGMSLYSNVHKNKIISHFRPDFKNKKINPLSYNLYKMSYENKNGNLTKPKKEELEYNISEIYRIFSAIMIDEKLIL
jgi:hypothetical protein